MPVGESRQKQRLTVDMVIGSRAYFLRQASSGFVGGPKGGDGTDRHITVAIDPETDLIKHIHMKSGRAGEIRENWRLHPERILPDLNNWIRANSITLSRDDIGRIDRTSYVVSTRRVLISFYILEGISTKIFSLFARGFRFIPLNVVKENEQTRIVFVIDSKQLASRIRRFRPLFKPYKAIIPRVFPRLVTKVARLHLVKIRDMTEGDVSFVFSREGEEPTVVVKQAEYRSIKLERVLKAGAELYSHFRIAELRPDLNVKDSPSRIEMVVREVKQ